MLTIQIKNWQNKVIATVNNIYSLQVDEEVNKWCKVKLRFPVEEWLQKKPVQKADRITIAYSFNIRSVVRIFEGYITDITLKSTEVVIEAENWLAYMQYRIIRSDKNYENVMIKDVISGLFNELNSRRIFDFCTIITLPYPQYTQISQNSALGEKIVVQ